MLAQLLGSQLRLDRKAPPTAAVPAFQSRRRHALWPKRRLTGQTGRGVASAPFARVRSARVRSPAKMRLLDCCPNCRRKVSLRQQASGQVGRAQSQSLRAARFRRKGPQASCAVNNRGGRERARPRAVPKTLRRSQLVCQPKRLGLARAVPQHVPTTLRRAAHRLQPRAPGRRLQRVKRAAPATTRPLAGTPPGASLG